MLHQTSPIDRDTIPADPAVSPPGPIAATARVVPSSLPSTSSSSPTIVRLWFPEGDHRRRFQHILANAPDPNLKIKKKSVRFEQNASLSPSLLNSKDLELSSASKDLRRDEGKIDCPVASSVAKAPVERKLLLKSSPSPPPISTTTTPRPLPVGYVYTNVPATPPAVVDHKDPEEKLAELMELKNLKVRQDDLLHLKDQIVQMNHNLEDKEGLLDEVRSERKSLQTELNRYVAMVKQIQKDYELTSQAEAQLIKERDDISQQLEQIRDHDYKTLKEEVDEMRTKKGLRPLPSLEQEQAEVMGRYLEERRGQWRHGDLQQGGTTSAASSSASFSNSHLQEVLFPEPASSSTSAGANDTTPSGSRSKSLRGSTSTSFLASASSSRGRENASGRSGRSHSTSGSTAHSSHARTGSTSSNKSRHDTHSRRSGSGGGRSSSRPGHRGQSLSRSHSPTPPETSQSSLREERQKKRARY